ncbi:MULTISPECIES: helix-turn-helix domain-containing protein [Romboutsia]|uniref:Helix-turn-helix domain of resolvase n=1 Tax=Romboutsia hominis TaxID=1507512 RepID=A0A2P2BMZ9_9FIRM|nr:MULTISPECIES: helix-turn-helix domain-containing protein [Romboutsia]MCH1958552.1 helix-turn-helix domain-containing protein [Romboutsia hominis]MCH1970470.1 helix-turn-helix domain-containing protein [Romboutsia hominis]MDB8789153.1 helix-turn-helix domain-containing protein [Romboutsia sp. 1001216sp1]MDB8802262.1 helix-turn-helix domain-containing protein [Romboutsia sp. 1001216sp1]MDB8810929.1 helix-turn-helix domain-containing protein [Romboutsia sp. 1001216sp1]
MKYKINTEIIKLQMLRKGYSITKLAKDSNLSKSTVSFLVYCI